MSGAPLRYVLGLLRRIKSGSELNVGHTAMQHAATWVAGGEQDAVFKLIIALQQNLSEARDVIRKSRLSEEAQLGLLSTIDGLIVAFSLPQLGSPIQSHLPAIDSSITNFAVITSAIDFEISDQFKAERDSFVVELEKFLEEMADFAIDERLKDTARRQISLLIALLKNAEAVGVEAALTSYWELVIKVRNRSVGSDEAQEGDKSKLWDAITSWSERLDSLSKIYDVGEKLLPYVDKIPQITGF